MAPFIVLLAVQPVVPMAPPAPPPAPPNRTAIVRLKNPQDIIRPKDYPLAAMRAGAEGAVRFRADVSAKGRATGCTVLESSGNAELDAATCRQVLQRAKFDPARDARGRKVADTLTRRVVWRLTQR